MKIVGASHLSIYKVKLYKCNLNCILILKWVSECVRVHVHLFHPFFSRLKPLSLSLPSHHLSITNRPLLTLIKVISNLPLYCCLITKFFPPETTTTTLPLFYNFILISNFLTRLPRLIRFCGKKKQKNFSKKIKIPLVCIKW